MLKCYIASPFFTNEQLEEVEQIKKILEELKIEYYSPKDFFILKQDASIKEQDKVVYSNEKEILNCDFMICNTNNKDMGSIFEAGYARAFAKSIIYFNSQFPKFNVMLARTSFACCNTFEQLKESIINLINNKSKIYKGLIE